MIGDMISNLFNNVTKDINLYTLPQYTWLIFTYYLMINAIYSGMENVLGEMEVELGYKIVPQLIVEGNGVVLQTLEEWAPFVFLFSILLIFSGILISPILQIPLLENTKISGHGLIGFYVGSWTLLASITYFVFIFNKFFFVVAIWVIYLLVLWIKYLNAK